MRRLLKEDRLRSRKLADVDDDSLWAQTDRQIRGEGQPTLSDGHADKNRLWQTYRLLCREDTVHQADVAAALLFARADDQDPRVVARLLGRTRGR